METDGGNDHERSLIVFIVFAIRNLRKSHLRVAPSARDGVRGVARSGVPRRRGACGHRDEAVEPVTGPNRPRTSPYKAQTCLIHDMKHTHTEEATVCASSPTPQPPPFPLSVSSARDGGPSRPIAHVVIVRRRSSHVTERRPTEEGGADPPPRLIRTGHRTARWAAAAAPPPRAPSAASARRTPTRRPRRRRRPCPRRPRPPR